LGLYNAGLNFCQNFTPNATANSSSMVCITNHNTYHYRLNVPCL